MNMRGYENTNNCRYSGRVIKGNPKRATYYYKKTKCKNYVPSEKEKESLFERILNCIKDILKEMM